MCRTSLRCFLLALAATSLFWNGCALPPRNETFEPVKIHFDSANGEAPPGFSTALTGGGGPPIWAVREDETAPDHEKILRQESAEPVNTRFPLCIWDGIDARDVAAEVSFKPISGTFDQAGGIVLRYTPGNYYIARANALENNVIFFKTVNGHRQKVWEVHAPVAPNEWHRLRFEANGRRLKIYLDGILRIDRTDCTFANSGKVGLWTKADSVSAFDDFEIERVP